MALTARAAGSRLQLEALPADGGRGLTGGALYVADITGHST